MLKTGTIYAFPKNNVGIVDIQIEKQLTGSTLWLNFKSCYWTLYLNGERHKQSFSTNDRNILQHFFVKKFGLRIELLISILLASENLDTYLWFNTLIKNKIAN